MALLDKAKGKSAGNKKDTYAKNDSDSDSDSQDSNILDKISVNSEFEADEW